MPTDANTMKDTMNRVGGRKENASERATKRGVRRAEQMYEAGGWSKWSAAAVPVVCCDGTVAFSTEGGVSTPAAVTEDLPALPLSFNWSPMTEQVCCLGGSLYRDAFISDPSQERMRSLLSLFSFVM